jgi:hypothetical protein
MAEQTDTTYPNPSPDPPDPMTVESLPAIHSRPCRGYEPGWTEVHSTFDEMVSAEPTGHWYCSPVIPGYRPRTSDPDTQPSPKPRSQPGKQWPTLGLPANTPSGWDANPMLEESSRPYYDPNWGDPCSSHAEYLENHARYIADHAWSKPVKQWPTIAQRITEEMLEVSTTSLQDLSVTQSIPVPLSVTQIIPHDH